MDIPARQPMPGEIKVIQAMLDIEFPGRTALCAQLRSLRVRQIDEEGSLQLVVDRDKPAKVDRRVPVEAMFVDSDGTKILILLHVVDGLLNELDVVRAGSGRLISEIDPAELEITVHSEPPIW